MIAAISRTYSVSEPPKTLGADETEPCETDHYTAHRARRKCAANARRPKCVSDIESARYPRTPVLRTSCQFAGRVRPALSARLSRESDEVRREGERREKELDHPRAEHDENDDGDDEDDDDGGSNVVGRVRARGYLPRCLSSAGAFHQSHANNSRPLGGESPGNLCSPGCHRSRRPR